MRPFISAITLAVLCCSILAGCSKDPIQTDLINYINVEMPKVAPLESSAMDSYTGVVAENYKTDQILYDTLTVKVIPVYKEFAQKLEEIKPATKEVRELHEKWVAAANKQLVAFNI